MGSCACDWTLPGIFSLSPSNRGHHGWTNPHKTVFHGTVALPSFPETHSTYYSLLLKLLLPARGSNSHVRKGCKLVKRSHRKHLYRDLNSHALCVSHTHSPLLSRSHVDWKSSHAKHGAQSYECHRKISGANGHQRTIDTIDYVIFRPVGTLLIVSLLSN